MATKQKTTKKAAKPATPKAKKEPKAPKPPKEKKERKLGLLSAGAQVLKASGKPMKLGEIYDAVLAKGLWTPGEGKTPKATLSAGIITEIAKKGEKSRFVKTGPGLFAHAKK